jgi:excisionase family DNA binding protein
VSEITVTLGDEAVEELLRLLAERAGVERSTEGFLDVQGAAGFLACPASRIYALVSAGRIPVERDGSRLLFDRAKLREYVLDGGAKRP